MSGDDRVGDNHFFEDRGVDAFNGRTGEYRMGGCCVDAEAACIAYCFCGVDYGSGGVDHVVDEEDVFAFDVSDDVHDFGHVGCWTAFVDNDEVGAEFFGEFAGQFDAADIWRSDDEVVVEVTFSDVVDEDDAGVEMVEGNVEEALYLWSVQVHGEDAVCSGLGQEIGYEFGRDGNTGSVFAVLTGIAVVGNDGGDACG